MIHDGSGLLQRVREFVADQRGVALTRVHPYSTLLGDLGLDGDEAREFFLAFAEEFGVDLSALELRRHFGTEGLPPWFPIYWIVLLLRKGSPEERARLAPLSVTDLTRAAATGRWVNSAGDARSRG